MSPYRHADVINRCTECTMAAFTRCLRCARFFCDNHAPGKKMRCVSCESHYLGMLTSYKTFTGMCAVLLSLFCALVLAGTAGSYFKSTTYPGILNAILLAPFGAWGLRAVSTPSCRRSFLSERPRRALRSAKQQRQLAHAPREA